MQLKAPLLVNGFSGLYSFISFLSNSTGVSEITSEITSDMWTTRYMGKIFVCVIMGERA